MVEGDEEFGGGEEMEQIRGIQCDGAVECIFQTEYEGGLL